MKQANGQFPGKNPAIRVLAITSESGQSPDHYNWISKAENSAVDCKCVRSISEALNSLGDKAARPDVLLIEVGGSDKSALDSVEQLREVDSQSIILVVKKDSNIGS